MHTFSSDDILYDDLHLQDMPTRMVLWYGMNGEVLREMMHWVNCIAYGKCLIQHRLMILEFVREDLDEVVEWENTKRTIQMLGGTESMPSRSS